MTKTKRLVAVALAILMVLSSFSMTSFAWNARSNDGFELTVNTEILREVNGQWVKTDKVEKGETVKARVYLGTDYFANSGQLLFFYSNKFFTDAYGTGSNDLVVNPYYSSNYGIKGSFYSASSTPSQAVEAQMLDDGRITSAEAAEYNPINVVYNFGSNVRNKKFIADTWFCEFTLTVKEDAPAGEFGRFLAFENTAASPDYTDGYIDIPKGTYDGYSETVTNMSNWKATLTFDNSPVEIYQNCVSVTFKTNGGEFADGSDELYFEGEAGTALTIETPTLLGYEFAGWLAEGATDAEEVTVYPTADTVYTAVWKDPSGTVSETLGFRTEIHRYNKETGEYEKTEKVMRGESVKARIFVDTSYFTNAGDIIVFYENDFFTDAYPTDESIDIVANSSATSSAALTGTHGSFTKTSATNDVIEGLLDNKYITSDFVKANNAFAINYQFNPTNSAVLSGDEWFVEFDLQVLNSAEDWGDFYIVEETIQNSGEGSEAYINIPLGKEGTVFEDGKHISMFLWDAITTIESNPVTVDSTITLEGEGGTFAENGEGTYVIEGYIGDAPVAPAEPTREGYAFMGWVDAEGNKAEIPDEIPYDDITLYATWSEKSEITFVFNNGTPDLTQEVVSGQPFEAPETPVKEGYQFIGWDNNPNDNKTDPKPLPDVYPAEDTVYSAVFETVSYYIYYYVLNPVDLQFDMVDVVTCEFGNEIPATPATYTVPEGYTLSPAYKDITFSTALAEGETMPAGRVDLYYKLTVNTYDATFDADGGVFADGTSTQTVPTVYGEQIVAPAAPTKEGFEFKGWYPEVGIMNQEGAAFVATWEEVTYYAEYIVDGATYEKYPTKFGEEVDVPADPYKEGYTFVEWTPAVDATMPAHDTEYIAVFDANQYDAIFKLEEDDEEAYKTIPAYYDDPIEVPEEEPKKQGYVFGGWVDENGNPPTTMDEEGKTFTAVWNPATDTKYVIETYNMNTDGTYSTTPSGTVEKSGTTGTEAEVTPNAAEGFYVDEETEETEEKSVLKAEILPDGSTVLKVYYAREKVTVTFDANDGLFTVTEDDGNEAQKEEIVYELYYGAAVVAPADPALTGYTFKGWDKAVVNKAIEDATYIAQWTVNKYTISFDTDGGSEIADITQDFGSDVTAPAEPTKPGYDFDKWVDGEGNEAEVPAKMPAEDTELTATWTPNTYDATFDADGGEWEDGTTEQKIPVVFDQPITEPAEDPKKDGYEFGGWVDEDGNPPANMDTEGGETYKPVWNPVAQEVPVEIYYMDTDGKYPETADDNDSVTFKTEETATYTPAEVKNYTVDAEKSVLEAVVAADGSTVLKVYYALDKTTISFDVDGTVTEVEGLIGAEVPAEEVPAPSKDGYTFEGWKDSEGNVSKDAPATFPEESETLEAVFTKNKYNVTFIVDGVKVEGYPKEVEFGSTIPVPANPSKGGYIFTGWLDDASHTPADYGTMPSTDLEFIAQWGSETGVGYVLEVYKMDTNGDYPAAPTETINFSDGVVGENRTVEYTAPEGFTLDNLKSELTGKIPATGTLVLKAYLERNQYTLTVDVDGVKTETEYYYGEAVTAPETPVKDGNVEFAGWVDGEGNEATVPAIMPAKDVTVYASWTTSAKFNAGEGKFEDGSSVKEIPVEVGEPITAPEKPERDGYDFVGWGTEADPETPVTDFGTMDENGESYVAIWTEATYEIIFIDYEAPENGPEAPTVPVEIARSEIKHNGTVTLPDDPTFLTGKTYNFVGWKDAEGKEYKEGDIYEGTADLVLYAQYERITVKLVPIEGSTTVVDRNGTRESYNSGTDRDENAYTPVNPDFYNTTEDEYEDYFIYGLKTRLKETVLLSQYITVLGDGRIEVIHAHESYAPYTGTGTVINVYDRVGTPETSDDIFVESFYIVIFGDINGDSIANSLDVSAIEDEAIGITRWSAKNSEKYVRYMTMAADVNYDTRVRTIDATLVENYSIGIGKLDQISGIAY
ncbi:MAG: InlB B-repeat-containing protein [Clostridia bacterium]|nr:InlB B-repeat-containing protein [Clostridia bacterium]